MTDRSRDHRIAWCVFLAALAIAAASARPWAGSWNDSSRLATVESVVDRHTFAIDDSIFVRGADPTDAAAVPVVTEDKLFIDGRFYSDKPPVLALLMAGLYELWQAAGGAPARQRPDQFCYAMTLATSGVAYAAAVTAIFLIGTALGLPRRRCLGLAASFALATVALAYTRHVNAHIVLLAVAAVVFLQLARQAHGDAPPRRLRIGTLLGFAYSVDLAAGPLLLVSVLAVLAYRARAARAVFWCAIAALPWVVLHHALDYAVGGTLAPANTVPEYLQWPGSPFGVGNMTGAWQHDSISDFLTYALALLFGRRGFVGHNLPLFLALAGSALLWRQRPRESPELVGGALWCVATWLIYALASNNYSGECASIRWFVPFLAPGYLALAVLLRERPRLALHLLVLSAWGCVLAALMWWRGPWASRTAPLFWPLQAAALVSWIACARYQHSHATGVAPPAVAEAGTAGGPPAGTAPAS